MNEKSSERSLLDRLILTLVIALLGTTGWARPGGIDRSFGNNGVLLTTHGNVSDLGTSTVQADGKFIFVGALASDFYVARFNPDGTLDNTFDGDGRATIAVSPRSDFAAGVFVQPDGKILVCGSSRNVDAWWDFAVVRLNPDGTPDTTFDQDGIQITPVSSTDDFGQAVTVQQDGKIVVAGQGRTNQMNMALVRYNSDGMLDSSFDGDGISIVQFPEGASTSSAIALQTDGKLVVAGAVGLGGQFLLSGFGLARFNTNGSPDTGFGSDGTVFADVRIGAAQQNSADAVLIQPDNRIVAVGNTNSGIGASLDFAMLRLLSDGTPDDSFGSAGKVVTTVSSTDDFAKAIAVEEDGRLLVGGRAQLASEGGFCLIRYNANGTIDTQFGNNGVSFVRPQTGNGISAIRLGPDGRISAFGHGRFDASFVKLFRNGYIDSDFDRDGKTDIGIFRPSVAEWWIQKSGDGSVLAAQFGATTDTIVPGDYTGDGKTDIAVWRPSNGEWFVLRSEDYSYYSFPFGTTGDIPITGDYDADGKADTAVFRPSNATWYIRRSTDGGATIETFGANGDVPIAADYDGDGKTDIAIFRPSLGQWWIKRSTAGVIAFTFGNGSDKPVQGDYTGDGKSDVAFWRPSTGEWFVLRSEDFSYYSVPFGTTGDIPAPGDYDGDGKFDTTVFRPSNATWYSNRSTAGTLIQQFGVNGDRPVPSAFVP